MNEKLEYYEITVGDYVKLDGKVTKIDVEDLAKVKNGECVAEPILITSDMLERNDFPYRKETTSYGTDYRFLIPHTTTNNGDVTEWETHIFGKNRNFEGLVTSVHDLQQVLYICHIKNNFKP